MGRPHETSFAPTRSVLSANARPDAWSPVNAGGGPMRAISRVLLAAVVLIWPGALFAQQIDWQRVDDAIAKPGEAQGDVRRYELPRTDLNVTIDGVTLKPNLALAGWMAFKPVQEGAWVTGELVLTETEVGPVMTKLLD